MLRVNLHAILCLQSKLPNNKTKNISYFTNQSDFIISHAVICKTIRHLVVVVHVSLKISLMIVSNFGFLIFFLFFLVAPYVKWKTNHIIIDDNADPTQRQQHHHHHDNQRTQYNRATLEQMRQAAAATSSDNRNGAARTNSNLVNNAQPLSFTNPPPFDSNV